MFWINQCYGVKRPYLTPGKTAPNVIYGLIVLLLLKFPHEDEFTYGTPLLYTKLDLPLSGSNVVIRFISNNFEKQEFVCVFVCMKHLFLFYWSECTTSFGIYVDLEFFNKLCNDPLIASQRQPSPYSWR
jgi:hypothetical protein